jgi:hypothetical protein
MVTMVAMVIIVTIVTMVAMVTGFGLLFGILLHVYHTRRH